MAHDGVFVVGNRDAALARAHAEVHVLEGSRPEALVKGEWHEVDRDAEVAGTAVQHGAVLEHAAVEGPAHVVEQACGTRPGKQASAAVDPVVCLNPKS